MIVDGFNKLVFNRNLLGGLLIDNYGIKFMLKNCFISSALAIILLVGAIYKDKKIKAEEKQEEMVNEEELLQEKTI